MDNIKIQIIGSGADLAIGEITDMQINYILSHQIECNKIIPLFNENFTIDYKNWIEVSEVCRLLGSTYKSGSSLIITINGNSTIINEFNEEKINVDISTFKNYMLSVKHVQGNILTYEFSVENFDVNKLTFLVKDLNSLFWGDLIYGIKYDGVIQSSVLTEVSEVEFENIIYKKNTVIPIQKN